MFHHAKSFNFLFAGLLCGLALVGNLIAGEVPFFLAQTVEVGMGPHGIDLADFNGDGIWDLVVADGDSDSVSILLGNGDGSFQEVSRVPVGLEPNAVAAGDFNGDGIWDVAAANGGSGDVSILLGNGDGSFVRFAAFLTGQRSHGIVVGDFNGDGIQDIAVPNGESDNVSILIGNGDGSFQDAVNYDVGSFPSSITLGDFNQDGVQDLVVTNAFSDSISILLGNGDGTFQVANTIAVGSDPESVTLGDFNGDTIVDLAVANFGLTDEDPSSISILIGNGDGTFSDVNDFETPKGARSTTIGDFNLDGAQDLAVSYWGSQARLSTTASILLGNGDGTFQGFEFLEAGNRPISILVADFNNDGLDDVAVVNERSDDVSILINGAQ